MSEQAAAVAAGTPDARAASGETVAVPRTRRARRRRRPLDLVVKADRAMARAFFGLLMPAIPGWMAWQAFTQDNLDDALVAGAVAVGLLLVLAPLNLWWSITAIRRGTRWMPLPILTGFIAGFETVLLVVVVAAGAVGYTVVTGNPVPGMDRYPQVQQEWMGVDWHDLLLGQPYNGQEEPDIAGLLDRIPR